MVREDVLKTAERMIEKRITLLKKLAEEHKYLKK